MRVLLIEDDRATAQSIELMLLSEGFNVSTTDLGEEGVDLGKIYDYDIILLDLNLPDISGYQVLRNREIVSYHQSLIHSRDSSSPMWKMFEFIRGKSNPMEPDIRVAVMTIEIVLCLFRYSRLKHEPINSGSIPFVPHQGIRQHIQR